MSKISGNVFFVGLMGAGKTTIGKLLAKRQRKAFYDSDQEIEKRTGVNIPLIFEVEGEAGFRAREVAMIAELSALENVILATGGGAVLNPENRENLQKNGVVVYLRAKVHDLWQRTRHDRNRPLLQTADPRARLAELYKQRDPLYLEIADIVIDTGDQTASALTHHLEDKLEEFHANLER